VRETRRWLLADLRRARREGVAAVARRQRNDWATDRQVTLDAARAFLADTDRMGEPFLGRYLLVTSSGTSGHPGIFLQDERYDAVSDALQAHMFRSWLPPRAILRLLLAGQRTAALFATGGHYAGYANAQPARRAGRATAKRVRVFSVHTQITHALERHGLGHVRVERDDQPPAQTLGGKYRAVIPLRDG
jgi:hypothetical protein